MCGIAGWYRRGGRDVAAAIVTAQCNAILHRGPDDAGTLIDGDFGMGMRRLSILDVAGGHQPMSTADGTLSIVFNGEIYNHLDVRAELPGHSFRTRSDTETILAAFAAWGNDAWAKFEGMFAVAIWHHPTRTLTLARDPIGIKPLYVSQQRGGLSFGSELKTLTLLPEHHFDVDKRAVHDFFSFGHVRRPRTIYLNVTMVEPGHVLTIEPEGASATRSYWRPRLRPGPTLSDDDWIERMREMLVQTTARHMQSDVPVGAFLSGGIDSSGVLAAMRRNTSAPIKAFTIGYPGAAIDETDAAARIAGHLGCEHIVLPLSQDDVIDTLPEVQLCFDEPFADMAAVPTWQVSRLASQHVKVVLCGEGGDELFAGYKRHRNASLIARYRPAIRALAPFANMLRRLPGGTSGRTALLVQHARRAAEFGALPDGYQQFFAATQISSQHLRRQVFGPELRDADQREGDYAALEAEYFGGAEAPHAPTASALEQFLYADLTLNMPSAMITRVDRASMAHSLEARVPFLSHKMVDWALTVPDSMKLRGTTGKYLLRRAIAPWLPDGIVDAPKQGFQMPLASWLRGEFGAHARELWRESGMADAGYLDKAAVDRLFAEHRVGAADHGRMLYAIAVFALWWRDRRWRGKPSDGRAALA